MTHQEQKDQATGQSQACREGNSNLAGAAPVTALGLSSDAAYWLLTKWHQKDSEKIIASAGPSPAAMSRSLLHPAPAAAYSLWWGKGLVSHTYLQMPSIPMSN